MSAPAVERQAAPGAAPLMPDLDQASQFLELLDPDAEHFCFQVFDDTAKKDPHIARTLYGSLDRQIDNLKSRQKLGCGVYVTINETQGGRRTNKDITRVRAAFADLDGAPIAPVLVCDLEPHMVVESSPGKYHAYWITEGMELGQFDAVQKAIAARFDGDPKGNSGLARVMRMPGFWHLKGEPFLSKITHLSDRMPYKAAEVLAEFPPVAQTNGHAHDATIDSATQTELVRQILTAQNYHDALRNLAWRYLVSGNGPKEVKDLLHGIMHAAPEPHDERWQARVNDIDRAVETAHRKVSALNLNDLSDDNLALSMGRDWEPDSRFVALWGKYLFWKDGIWQVDETKHHVAKARKWLRIHAEAIASAHPSMRKAAKKLRDGGTIMALSRLVGTNDEIAAHADIWDQNQMLAGGKQTIDLAAGDTRAPLALDYITQRVAVDPAPRGTRALVWEQFLHTVTGGDDSLKGYLQRMAGYWLTGSIAEHAFFFVYGLGGNGKSTFVETIQAIMGDYATTVSSEMLMISNTDRHPTEIAQLRGKRLAVASEIEQGKSWAEAKIKSLTGGDTVHARFMRQDFFTFNPTFKLVVYGNHKPSLRNVDAAIQRRMHLVPFTAIIPQYKQDKHFRDKLKPEWPAILRWAMDGCLLWQEFGLKPPEIVKAATVSYLESEDSFELWRAECTKPDRAAWAASGDLYASWRAWCDRAGEYSGSQKSFSNKLLDHGFVPERKGANKNRGYSGAVLITAHTIMEKQGHA